MDEVISRQAAIDALEKVAELFPWRVLGNRDTYDRYNEAWNDAIGRAEIEIEELPSARPEEDCDTCKHGYFGDCQCDNCRVRYPSHYEREEEHHGSD